jgi:cytochrome c peroxidase
MASRLSKKMKSSMTIFALVATTVIAGHAVSAQVAPQPPPSLKTVSVPEPDNLGDFIKDKTAAIALGKSLFWDMQVGSDGIQSCATCHFHAGADSRSKNQLNPGLNRVNADKAPNPDKTFNAGGPNYTLTPEDYPFHKLADPNNRLSMVLADTNDVTSSQGVFHSKFIDIVPGSAQDQVIYQPDPNGFKIGDTNVRRVASRNTPSVINAVFNFRNFWDGRAQNIFNGVNPFGQRDPNAFVLKATNPTQVQAVQVKLNNSSLASQALGPPLSDFEMSATDRPFAVIGKKFGPNSTLDVKTVRKSAKENQEENENEDDDDKSHELPRETSKKLSYLRPLGKQIVHPDDSVLGVYSRAPEPGIKLTYEKLVEIAFKPEWWKSNLVIRIDQTGKRTFIQKANHVLDANEFTLMDYNFSLFFGLAVQMYESTLVSNNTPFDQFREGNTSALTAQQQKGLEVFVNKGLCIKCHSGAEFTNASVANVQNKRLVRSPAPGNPVQDNGFFKIGVRPPQEDLGAGDNDPFGNSLSEAQLAQQGKFKQLLGQDPNLTVGSTETVVADGAFKASGLRNIELTAPYFHNGGQLTLRQVVDFYSRGGDFGGLPVLNLSEEEKEALVVFLNGLTDDRVRYERTPFDHPQLFIPNGHFGDTTSVTNDGTGKATDALLEIPAVGRGGLKVSLPNFLATP